MLMILQLHKVAICSQKLHTASRSKLTLETTFRFSPTQEGALEATFPLEALCRFSQNMEIMTYIYTLPPDDTIYVQLVSLFRAIYIALDPDY